MYKIHVFYICIVFEIQLIIIINITKILIGSVHLHKAFPREATSFDTYAEQRFRSTMCLCC